MAYSSIIVLAVALVTVLAAPQNQKSERQLSSIPTEDLTHIIKVRNGEPTTPPKNISPCARAILACCRGNVMNPDCSENLKCGAFFFDVNPCDDKYVEEALQAAKNFYEQINKVQINN